MQAREVSQRRAEHASVNSTSLILASRLGPDATLDFGTFFINERFSGTLPSSRPGLPATRGGLKKQSLTTWICPLHSLPLVQEHDTILAVTRTQMLRSSSSPPSRVCRYPGTYQNVGPHHPFRQAGSVYRRPERRAIRVSCWSTRVMDDTYM
jgi:hypothetical protein